jgi:hypothetical protein
MSILRNILVAFLLTAATGAGAETLFAWADVAEFATWTWAAKIKMVEGYKGRFHKECLRDECALVARAKVDDYILITLVDARTRAPGVVPYRQWCAEVPGTWRKRCEDEKR